MDEVARAVNILKEYQEAASGFINANVKTFGTYTSDIIRLLIEVFFISKSTNAYSKPIAHFRVAAASVSKRVLVHNHLNGNELLFLMQIKLISIPSSSEA